MKTAILIPARYGSTRFEGKPLAMLDGVPMIKRVYDACVASKIPTYVLTDDVRIASVFQNTSVIIDDTNYANGTERCAGAINIDYMQKYDQFINVQGDMPDITSDIIRAVENELQRSDVATAYTPMDFNLRNDPNSVKMIHSRGRAHWFLRASLTYGDHHLGVYGYNREAKAMYTTSRKFIEEDIEKLEQLRWIQNGIKIGVVEVEFDGIEINSPQDLKDWHIKNEIRNN